MEQGFATTKRKCREGLALALIAFFSCCAWQRAGAQDEHWVKFWVDAKNQSSDHAWLDTGITVSLHDILTIRADGVGCLNGHTGCSGPYGTTVNSCGPIHCGALIGKIGPAGTSFFVGGNWNQTVSGAGNLYLAYNDIYWADNTGGYQVLVFVHREAPIRAGGTPVASSRGAGRGPGTGLILIIVIGLLAMFGALLFLKSRRCLGRAQQALRLPQSGGSLEPSVMPVPSQTIGQPQPSPDDAARNELENLINQAKSGNADAQLQLAELYDNGRGVPQDHVQAFKWCQRAAGQGMAQAQYLLGKKYLNGEGTSLHKKKGIELLRKAAKQDLQEAQDDLLRYE